MTWPPFTAIYCSNVRKSKTVLDSGLQVLDSSTGNLYSGFLELYSGFQSPGFWIFKPNFPWFPDTTSRNFPDSFKLGYLFIFCKQLILLKNALLLDSSIWTTAIEQNYITDISKSPTDMIQIKIVHFWLQVWLTDIDLI